MNEATLAKAWHEQVSPVRHVTLRSAAVAGVLALSCALQLPIQPAGAAQVRAGLADLAAGRADWAAFAVTYDDLQGIHGGLILTIHGDGRVEQRVVRTQAGEPRKVSRPDLERLVTLLREVQSWEQRTPARPPIPDESTSRLTVQCGGAEASIWEWYNDMPKNARIIRVRDLMTEIGWSAK